MIVFENTGDYGGEDIDDKDCGPIPRGDFGLMGESSMIGIT